ncbi:hypothetical protein [Deinococcus roseus]|uniref:Uncharacterized protein n=1 Tax=Deinococcus roseus TaxID=392414 RepID=A0ABQ2D0N4_9DEIO|nr:hypothetical protein [Deinococcus roseus]GGJ39406.1 hypothetical protein GCM10008938_26840 [Deinococcus roseus]
MDYQLQINNNTQQPGSFVIFQTTRAPGPYSVAWQSKYTYPSTTLTFKWTANYDFIWSSTAQLTPGVVFQAAQAISATPQTNRITLSYDLGHHAFYFQNQTEGTQAGTFQIQVDSSVPVNAVAVGIGMDSKPTFAIGGQPNMNFQFEIPPANTYWVAFTSGTEQGEVLDRETLNPVEVVFPINVDSMTVTLNPDLTWKVVPNHLLKATEEG